jgi:outer membrane protein TolC
LAPRAFAQDSQPAKVPAIAAGSVGGDQNLGSQYLSTFKSLPLEIKHTHEQNKTLSMSPIHLGSLIQVASMRPLRLEASYDEPISLADALNYAKEQSLTIKIAHESAVYQYAALGGQLANFLPSFSMGLTFTKSHVAVPDTHSSSRVFSPRVGWPLFVGGSNVYSAMVQYYRAKGWNETFKSNVNDALLNVYTAYTNLALNHALLKIRVKAVEVSELQLKLNEQLLQAGTGTRFAIMQSRSQLASDRQALLAQQIATRQSSLLLGYALDMPLAANLVPDQEYLTETRIVDEKLAIDKALDVALLNRPELRQFELFRYAAARGIQNIAANLYPTVSIASTYNSSETVSQVAASNAGSATGSSTSNGTTAGAGIFAGVFNTTQNTLSLGWSLPNFGMATVANIIGAKALSRQALLQANQELQLVRQQVRSDYIVVMSVREQIDNAAYGVDSSTEALRLANLRMATGIGTNLELIQAENTYINALYTQAQAIIASNQAQAQLLHDMGVISVDTLQHGYLR